MCTTGFCITCLVCSLYACVRDFLFWFCCVVQYVLLLMQGNVMSIKVIYSVVKYTSHLHCSDVHVTTSKSQYTHSVESLIFKHIIVNVTPGGWIHGDFWPPGDGGFVRDNEFNGPLVEDVGQGAYHRRILHKMKEDDHLQQETLKTEQKCTPSESLYYILCTCI